MLGSILTRQYRFATRGVRFTFHVAHQAVDVAGEIVGAVAGRIVGHDGDSGPEVVDGEFVSEPPARRPAARPTPPRDTATAPGPTRMPPAPGGDTSAEGPESPAQPAAAAPPAAAPPAEAEPAEAEPAGAQPTGARSAAAPARRAAAPPERTDVPAPPVVAPMPETIADEPPTSIFPEPDHVSEGAELVEEVAEPGAEDGAGAEVRFAEPWDGYRHLKARDIVARLENASREELAAVELYEMSHANRKSVVAAAQRALKQASPPR